MEDKEPSQAIESPYEVTLAGIKELISQFRSKMRLQQEPVKELTGILRAI